MRKAFVGAQLRRLREGRHLSQASLADALGLPVDHVSQLELNQRPLTIPLLLDLNAMFGIDVRLADDGRLASEERLATELGQALSLLAPGEPVDYAEVRHLVANMPAIARALIALCREPRQAPPAAVPPPRAPPLPDEEVREYFRDRHGHIAELDAAAEALHRAVGLAAGDPRGVLAAYLARRHGIHVRIDTGQDEGGQDEGGQNGTGLDGTGLDEAGSMDGPDARAAAKRTLRLSGHLPPGRHAFLLATRLAFLEQGERLHRLAGEARFFGEEARGLARVDLAKYFAAALLLPYGAFRDAAEALRYDVERLARRFDAGFEMVCQRLATLQRPGAEGVPFLFVRLDRAGNVSKWQAAADLPLRPGDSGCPLWNVHETFAHPGRILTQYTRMPDDRTYFWIARAITRSHGGYGAPTTSFSVGLGCELRHAWRLVYSAGLDVNRATPVGPGCRRCQRPSCPQRAYPAAPAAASR
ncbi:XRE family transcriptional regulator [Allostella vacuolata]|nr:XRE family transcriptional regulator [Stella vacuolata]